MEKKKREVEFEIGLDGAVVNGKKNNNIEFEVGLDGTVRKNNLIEQKKKTNSSKKDDASVFKKIGKTIINIPTLMGEGAMKTVENVGDWANKASEVIDKPVKKALSKLILGYSEEEAEKFIQEELEANRKYREEDTTQNILDYVGWDDEFRQKYEKDSLIRSDNTAGQVVKAVGGMVPQLVVGQAAGSPLPTKSTVGLSTGKKILTTAGNVGKTALSTAPSNLILGTSAYGGALEEAYKAGATEEEAEKYAFLSTTTELATEWITGGIPGIEGTGIIDNGVKGLIDKSTGKLKGNVSKAMAKAILNYGYEAVGEGLEEAISEIVSPMIKNATYSEGEKIDWNNVFQSAIIGATVGGFLNAPGTISDLKNDLNSQKATLPTGTVSQQETNNASVEGNPLINNQKATLPIANMTVNNAANVENNSSFEFVQSDNAKINNLRESASRYLDNSDASKSFISTAEKLVSDKGYNIILDDSISTETGNKAGKITTLDNGEVEIRINPNSERAGEFLLIHEVTHAIETKEMVDLVIDYAKKHPEYESALESLKQSYNTDNVTSEVLADINAQLFGNQEFINSLSLKKPNIFKRIYNSIISLANKITGNSRESLFISDLKNKFEKAYRMSYNNTKQTTMFATEKNNPYGHVKEFVKLKQETQEEAHRVISPVAAKLSGTEEVGAATDINGNTYKFDIFEDGIYRVSEVIKLKENIMEVADEIYSNGNRENIERYTEHGQNINGSNNESNRYDGASPKTSKISTREQRQQRNNENGILTKTQSRNNRELDNSSFSFKQKQLDIILKNNPVEDDYHTWIRKIDDIKTFEETLEDSDYKEYYEAGENFDETYSAEMAREALSTGKITVYSSYPIEQGIFVSPSKMEAESYSGNGKVYSKEVKLSDVAWIDPTQGQYAKVDNTKYSNENNNSWDEYIENNYKSTGTKTEFNNIRKKDNVSTERKLLDKKTDKITKKYEKEKEKSKKYITKNAAKILEFDNYNQKKEFQELITDYYDNPNYETIRKDIKEKFSEKRIEYINDELKEIKRHIRGTDLKVDDYVKKNLTDYNFFRKSNFNKLKLKNDGMSIDSFYTELTEQYPSIFSKDITNEVDQLYRLSEFMDEDITLVEKYHLDDNVLDEAAKYIYDSIKNEDNIDDLINSISISPKEIRKEKTIEYREFAESFLENSDSWNDKKMGLSYKVNTMKRNFYDVMGKKDGERMYTNFIEPIFKHNSQMQKDIQSYNSKIEKLKLNEKESIAVQMFGEYKYNPETLVTGPQIDEFIETNKLDYKKISEAVEVFRGIYDEVFPRINSVLKEQGYKEIEYRKGYFPHFTVESPNSTIGKFLEKMGWKFKDNSIPTDIAGITEMFKPGKVWTSFSQRRKGKFTDYDALQGFDNYIRGAMETIYFSEDIQKLRALENEIRYQHSDSGVQAQIDEIHSDNSLTFEEKQEKIDKIYAKYTTPMNNLVTELRDYTNGIANKKSGLDRTMESLTNRKVYSVMQNISNRLSANMVGLNFGSAITNFIPITQATSQVKTKYLLKGLKEAVKNQYTSDGFETKSVFLMSRLNAADRLYKTQLEKLSDKANFMFEGIDSITSNTIVRAKYYENISKGMSEYNAMRNADEFARDLIAGRTKGEMPTAFNSKNPLIRMFTAFQLEVNNQYGYMFKDLHRDLKDEGLNKLIGGFIKMFIGAWLYNQLTEKVVGRKSAFSPADTIEEIYSTATNKNLDIKEKSTKILENITQDIPFVGSLVGGGRLPISSVANPLNVIKGESTVADEAKKLLYYTVLPFGGGQLKKTNEGISMYVNDKKIKGSYTSKGKLRFEAEKDLLSVIQNVLFGQYSSKNAREYFDNAYLPLDEKSQKEIESLDISVSDYRKYRDHLRELSEIKSDKDEEGNSISGTASGKKAYAIMNSNYSKKEKNYLLSKLSSSEKKTTVKDLQKISNSEETYKFFYGLNYDNREKFIDELNSYNINCDDLVDYYKKRKEYQEDYTSQFSKIKIIDYLQSSKLDDKTKYYLYSKDYSSENEKLLLDTFKIDIDDYFKVIKYQDTINKKYRNQSKVRKNKMFGYINNMNLNAKQKIVLFKVAGYTNSSTKKAMYTYINELNISANEKKKIFENLY